MFDKRCKCSRPSVGGGEGGEANLSDYISTILSMYMYMYMFVCICMYVYIYIYIYNNNII